MGKTLSFHFFVSVPMVVAINKCDKHGVDIVSYPYLSLSLLDLHVHVIVYVIIGIPMCVCTATEQQFLPFFFFYVFTSFKTSTTYLY